MLYVYMKNDYDYADHQFFNFSSHDRIYILK